MDESRSMMRAFCAIELTETCRHTLAKAEGILKACGVRSGIVRPGNMHLTLRFLGEVDTAVISTVTELLQQTCANEEPFRLLVGGPGAFPNWRRPSAVWMGVAPHEGPLARVQAAAEEACRCAGLAPEPRAFRPHITLARVRDPSVAERVRACREPLEALGTCEIVATGVTLFESQPIPAGPVYRRVWRGAFSEQGGAI